MCAGPLGGGLLQRSRHSDIDHSTGDFNRMIHLWESESQILAISERDAHFPSQSKLLVGEVGQSFAESLDTRGHISGSRLDLQAVVHLLLFLFQVGVGFQQPLGDLLEPGLLCRRKSCFKFPGAFVQLPKIFHCLAMGWSTLPF